MITVIDQALLAELAADPEMEALIRRTREPYERELAAYPVVSLRSTKYWAPVSRIDGAYGDRNLVCSCPSIEELAAAE